MTLSYLEIYNENIRDLLKPSTGTLDLREDAKKGTIEVAGLSEVSTMNTKEVRESHLYGLSARQWGRAITLTNWCFIKDTSKKRHTSQNE